MKRFIYAFVILGVFIFVLAVSIKPIAVFFVKKQLKEISLKSGITIEGFALKRLDLSSITMGRVRGNFYVAKIRYNKLRIDDIQGEFLLRRSRLVLSPVYASLLGGKAGADLESEIADKPKYSLNIRLFGVDMDEFVNDFDLKEKFQLTGRLNGGAKLTGENTDIKVLNGNFSTSGLGGVLIIKDTKSLENMARNSGESLDIFAESFNNYHYNTGTLKVVLDRGNLIFNVVLEGEMGRRDLTITLHDFKLERSSP